MKRRLLVVIALLATALLGAPSASAASSYAITSVAFGPSTVTVVGLLGTGYVHIQVGVHSDPPVAPCFEEPGNHGVSVRLWKVGAAWVPDVTEVWQQLTLTSGTSSDGTWSGLWRAGSGYGGTWRISLVTWCNGQDPFTGDSGYGVDPAVALGFTGTVNVVAGSPPRVTVTRTPAVAVYGTRQWVTYRYTNAHGSPLAGRQVGWAPECGLQAVLGLRLDAQGRVTVRRDRVPCLLLTQPQTVPTTSSATVVRFDWVTGVYRFSVVRGVPAGRRFTVGKPARVAASVWPQGGTTLLQLRVGRTWRTVGSSAQHSYSVWISLPDGLRASLVRGAHQYRLVATYRGPGDRMVPTASATFVMTGT